MGSPRKLCVVVPALDEQETIGAVVAAVPRSVTGVDAVEVVVVDDGSRDETTLRAQLAGADFVVTHARNRGLVAAFNTGITAALARGADVVATLDGDGQHDPRALPRIIEPIVTGKADVVVGTRPLRDASQGTPLRRLGNRVGTAITRMLLDVPLTDVTSGYRAFSRQALLRLHVLTDCTYTLETLLQAARRRLAIAEVVVAARPRTVGRSRMTHSIGRYVARTGGEAMRTLLHANPLGVFGSAAIAAAFGAALATAWFFVGYQDGGMHLPALLTAVLLALASCWLLTCALLADGIGANRRLLEDALERVRRMEADGAHARPVTEEPPLDAWAASLDAERVG